MAGINSTEGINNFTKEAQMANALILWSSRIGETVKIGELIAKGLREAGCEADIRDVAYVESEAEVTGYDALVLGSSTYIGEMNQPMKKFLFMVEKIRSQWCRRWCFRCFRMEWGSTPAYFQHHETHF